MCVQVYIGLFLLLMTKKLRTAISSIADQKSRTAISSIADQKLRTAILLFVVHSAVAL